MNITNTTNIEIIGIDCILNILKYLDINSLRNLFQISKMFYRLVKPIIIDFIDFFKYRNEFKMLGHFEAILSKNDRIIKYLKMKYKLPFGDYLNTNDVKILASKGYGLILYPIINKCKKSNKFKKIVYESAIINGDYNFYKQYKKNITSEMYILSDHYKILEDNFDISNFKNNIIDLLHLIITNNKYKSLLFIIDKFYKDNDIDELKIKITNIMINNVNTIGMFEFISSFCSKYYKYDDALLLTALRSQNLDLIKILLPNCKNLSIDFYKTYMMKYYLSYETIHFLCNELNINIDECLQLIQNNDNNNMNIHLYQPDISLTNIFDISIIIKNIADMFEYICYNNKYVELIEYCFSKNPNLLNLFEDIDYLCNPDNIKYIKIFSKYDSKLAGNIYNIMKKYTLDGYKN